MTRGRTAGKALLALVPVFLLLTVGLAFTIFAEIAALLGAISLLVGMFLLFGPRTTGKS